VEELFVFFSAMLSSLGRAGVWVPLRATNTAVALSRPGCVRHLPHLEQRRLRPPLVPHLRGDLTLTAAASSSASKANANDTLFWRVVIATGLTLLLCSVDRICMSVAILPMAAEFSWSPSVQGVVQAAFLVGYAMTQAIGGALADRIGGKIVTAYAIKLFSLASLILPICLRVAPVEYTLAIVVAVRFLGADLRISSPLSTINCSVLRVSSLMILTQEKGEDPSRLILARVDCLRRFTWPNIA
jgi:hypothetical protein